MKSAAGKPQVSELKLNIFTAFLSPSVETPNNGKLNLRSINTSRTHASNAQQSIHEINKTNSRNSIQMNKKSVEMKKLLDSHQELYSNIDQFKFQTKQTNKKIQQVKQENQDLIHNYERILSYLNQLPLDQQQDSEYPEIKSLCQNILHPPPKPDSMNESRASTKAILKERFKKITSIFQQDIKVINSIHSQEERSDGGGDGDDRESVVARNQRLERENRELRDLLKAKEESNAVRMNNIKNLFNRVNQLK